MTDDRKLPVKKLWWWVATWFGSGLSPKAPGTAGSLAALPFAYVIQYYMGNAALFIAAAILFFIGWWASIEYMKHYPEKHDPKQIVVDEVVGMWLLIYFLGRNVTGFEDVVITYGILFLVFRFFDALKPWPISVADRKIKGGFGVMLDDVFAALYPMLIYTFIMLIYTLFFWKVFS